MAGTIVNNPVVQFFDNNGNPLAGGKITTYLSNTTTPASTWQNEALSVLNTNPIVLNSRGEATIWLTPDIQYTFVLTDANDNLVQTVNDIYGGFQSVNGIDASQINYTPAGTGAVATTVEQQLMKLPVFLENYGAIPGTDCTDAWQKAAATGRPIILGYGDYILNSPVTVSSYIIGYGADDGQSTITLTGTGQLIVGDWNADWSGFFIRSAVNNKVFIRVPGISYFKMTKFRMENQSGATGQIGIQFDTTTASVYFANIDDFKIRLDYPFDVIGNNTQVFNANKIGSVATGYYQNFLSAIAVNGVLACDANEFAGYFEVGTNAVNHVAGALRQNRFRFVLDAVTRAYNTAVTVTDPNIWEILSGGFTVGGTYPQNQILIGPAATKVRATNSTADSIPNATATILKFDNEVYDTLSEFAPGSGIFQPRNAGYYYIDAAAFSASVAWDAGERWEIRVYKNGIEYAKGDWNVADAATTRQRMSRVCTTLFMNGTTDTADVRIIHNQGAAVLLDTAPTGNYIDISRIQ